MIFDMSNGMLKNLCNTDSWLIIGLLFVCMICVLAVASQSTGKYKCDALGGEYHVSDDTHFCIKDNKVIDRY